jgi:hypothetical protein
VSPQSPDVWRLQEVGNLVVGMCSESGIEWRLYLRISSLTDGIWRSLRITVFGTYQGESTIVRKTLDWKRSRIAMLEAEAVPQSCIP